MSSTAPPADPEIVPYEFGRPSQLSDEKAALYRDAAGRIATEAQDAIGRWTPGFTLEVSDVTEIAAGAPVAPDDPAYDIAPLVTGPISCGLLAVQESLGLMLVSGTVGGGSKPEIEARPLTSIEVRVLDLVAASILEVAQRVLLTDDLGIERGRGDGFQASDDETPKSRVGFSFTVHGPREEGNLVLAIDIEALQRFSDAIDRRLSGSRPTAPIPPSPLTAQALEPVPLFLTVGVGRAELTAREVVELRQGDVIRTRVPVQAPLVASAGDKELFEVRVVEQGRRLVAEILAPITAENRS